MNHTVPHWTEWLRHRHPRSAPFHRTATLLWPASVRCSAIQSPSSSPWPDRTVPHWPWVHDSRSWYNPLPPAPVHRAAKSLYDPGAWYSVNRLPSKFPWLDCIVLRWKVRWCRRGSHPRPAPVHWSTRSRWKTSGRCSKPRWWSMFRWLHHIVPCWRWNCRCSSAPQRPALSHWAARSPCDQRVRCSSRQLLCSSW